MLKTSLEKLYEMIPHEGSFTISYIYDGEDKASIQGRDEVGVTPRKISQYTWVDGNLYVYNSMLNQWRSIPLGMFVNNLKKFATKLIVQRTDRLEFPVHH